MVADGLEERPEPPCVSWRGLPGRSPVADSPVALRACAGYVVHEQRRGRPGLPPGDKEDVRVIGQRKLSLNDGAFGLVGVTLEPSDGGLHAPRHGFDPALADPAR